MKNIELELRKMKHLFEYQLGDNKKLLREYDIDDDNKMSFMDELTSEGGDEIMKEVGISLTSQEDVINSLDNTEICQMSDMDGYVEKKFGQIVKDKFKDKAEEILDTIKEYMDKFIDFLHTLTVKDLKKLFKNIKSKKSEAEKSVSDNEEVLSEFFGTSMALVTIFGSFTMPALILTIASVVLVTLIAIWLANAILCSFNISLKSVKRCRVRSFEWGQCK
jgi:hypothetical protein